MYLTLHLSTKEVKSTEYLAGKNNQQNTDWQVEVWTMVFLFQTYTEMLIWQSCLSRKGYICVFFKKFSQIPVTSHYQQVLVNGSCFLGKRTKIVLQYQWLFRVLVLLTRKDVSSQLKGAYESMTLARYSWFREILTIHYSIF